MEVKLDRIENPTRLILLSDGDEPGYDLGAISSILGLNGMDFEVLDKEQAPVGTVALSFPLHKKPAKQEESVDDA